MTTSRRARAARSEDGLVETLRVSVIEHTSRHEMSKWRSTTRADVDGPRSGP